MSQKSSIQLKIAERRARLAKKKDPNGPNSASKVDKLSSKKLGQSVLVSSDDKDNLFSKNSLDKL